MKSSSSWLSLDIEIVYHCGYLLSADRGGSPRATQYFDRIGAASQRDSGQLFFHWRSVQSGAERGAAHNSTSQSISPTVGVRSSRVLPKEWPVSPLHARRNGHFGSVTGSLRYSAWCNEPSRY